MSDGQKIGAIDQELNIRILQGYKYGDFGQLHSLWARKHYSTYKLAWESMNSNRKACTVSLYAITECIALLYNGILGSCTP